MSLPRSLAASEVMEVARFLVRIFGDEALCTAVERAETSDQAEDWRCVAEAVAQLLDIGAPRRVRFAR
jgi:hypothetical protein